MYIAVGYSCIRRSRWEFTVISSGQARTHGTKDGHQGDTRASDKSEATGIAFEQGTELNVFQRRREGLVPQLALDRMAGSTAFCRRRGEPRPERMI